MLLGVPLTELLWLAVAVIIAGVITGLLAGLFGVGGGAVIVPVLYEVFRLLGVPDEVRMQLCIGTSIAIILPTTLRSYHAHREKGLVIPGIIRMWAVPAVIGVACGPSLPPSHRRRYLRSHSLFLPRSSRANSCWGEIDGMS